MGKMLSGAPYVTQILSRVNCAYVHEYMWVAELGPLVRSCVLIVKVGSLLHTAPLVFMEAAFFAHLSIPATLDH